MWDAESKNEVIHFTKTTVNKFMFLVKNNAFRVFFVCDKVKMKAMKIKFNRGETELKSRCCRVERGPLSIRRYHQHIGGS